MNIHQTEISFKQAYIISQQQQQKREEYFDYLIEEIKTSDPTMLSALDFEYYARELEENCPDGKKYTSNDIRHMMMDGKDVSSFDMIDSFIDASDDSIIDFF